MMSLSFRNKLIAIVAAAAAGFLTLLVVNVVLSRKVIRQIDSVEEVYIPKMELRPTLERKLEDITRGMQDAVAAGDVEKLAEVKRDRDEFLAKLESARGFIDDAEAEKLRVALERYHETANSISVRLIDGETGEALVSAMQEMQTQKQALTGQLEVTTRFERAVLENALQDVRRMQEISIRVRVGVIVASLLLVIGLSYWLLGGLFRSVDELVAGFERFGSGELESPITVSTDDELKVLATHANRMAESLRHSIAELEAFNYSVSHDLRAPLRPLDGFSQALIEDYAEQLPDKAKDYLKRIRAAAQRMSQLIEDMLQLSRLGRAELAVRPVDIVPIAESVIAELRRNEPARQVEYVSVKEAKADGDSRLLRIVLENLLRNAWKFSRNVEHARIELGTRQEDGRTVFFVRDNGAGFDPMYKSKLFQPFQRLHVPRDFEGTGIGLAIVQRIVRRHDGRVWADGAPGQGATFFFTLHETKAET